MRFSAKTWVIIAVFLIALGVYFWQWGNRVQEEKKRAAEADPSALTSEGAVRIPSLNAAGPKLLTQLDETTRHANQVNPEVTSAYIEPLPEDPLHPHRLRNTAIKVNQLVRLDHALLLNKALIDTSSRRPLNIPPIYEHPHERAVI